MRNQSAVDHFISCQPFKLIEFIIINWCLSIHRPAEEHCLNTTWIMFFFLLAAWLLAGYIYKIRWLVQSKAEAVVHLLCTLRNTISIKQRKEQHNKRDNLNDGSFAVNNLFSFVFYIWKNKFNSNSSSSTTLGAPVVAASTSMVAAWRWRQRLADAGHEIMQSSLNLCSLWQRQWSGSRLAEPIRTLAVVNAMNVPLWTPNHRTIKLNLHILHCNWDYDAPELSGWMFRFFTCLLLGG